MTTQDLSDVPTVDLVIEAMRRAPVCSDHAVPMLRLGPTWHACPVDGATVDYSVTDRKAGR